MGKTRAGQRGDRWQRVFASVALVGVVGAIVVWSSAGAAQAAIMTFSMSPASGPPGTVVHVSGTGCAPGLLALASTDFVAVTAPTLDVAFRAPVSSSGAWQGSFTVEAGLLGAGAAPVAAVCVSSGVQSLLTIYTPQTFSVTAVTASTTTMPGQVTAPGETSTTTPHVPKGGTSEPVSGTPRRPDAKGPNGSTAPTPTLGPGLSASLPGRGIGGGGGTATPGGTTSTASGGSGSDAREAVAAGKKHSRAAGVATLQPADLGAALASDRAAGSGGLGWLGSLLLLAALVAAVGAPLWLWRSRRNGTSADPAGETV